MDRRFFENDNVEDLSKNESPKSFQKIEEENEVLKENYMWSDEEDDFSFETDLITILSRIVAGICVYSILSLKHIIKSIKSEQVLFNEGLYER